MKPYKVIDRTDDTLTIEGYIAIWGDEKNKDLDNEFFHKATKFDSSYTETNTVLLDWEHGMSPDKDAEGKALPQPGRHDPLGTVNMKTAVPDNTGLLAQMILQRRQWYVSEIVEPLIEAELVGGSSEAIPEGVVTSKGGAIDQWPLYRHTLTVTPADPRQLTDHQVSVIKSIKTKYPTLKSYLLEVLQDDNTTDENGGNGDGKNNSEVLIDNDVPKKQKEQKTMSDEQEKQTPVFDSEALIAGIGAEFAKVATELKEAQAEEFKAWKETNESVKSGGVSVTGDEADRALEGNPFKTPGEFYMEVKKAGMGQKHDDRILPLKSEMSQEGVIYKLPKTAAKAMKAPSGLSELVPADGGFLVGSDRRTEIGVRTEYQSQLWNMAFDLPIGPNSNGTTLNMVDETSRANGSRWGGVRGYWLAEADEKTASKPTFDQIEPKLKKVVALVYATDEVMMDATQLGALLSVLPPQELDFQKDDKAFGGSGVGVPLGYMNSPALVTQAKETGQAANTVVAQNIINMYSRREGSAANYAWYINQEVEPQLHQLNLPVGTGGALVYMPPGGLSSSPYGSLYGRPVIPIEQAEALGTVGDITFVNMMKYQTISKGGVQSAESIHVRFIYDESVFRFVERVDGMPMVKKPLTPYKGTNTLSPFVALATRS